MELAGGITALVPPVPGVVFTTRLGGVSEAPYDSLNLSTATGDDPSSVAANRARVAEALGISASWSTARQVHGCEVLVTGPGAWPRGAAADGLLSTEEGRPVVSLIADCVPIALTGPGMVGVVHAGWRGLCSGVIAAAVTRAHSLTSGPVAGWIGPCIGPCCFAVGQDVPAAFAAGHPGAPDCTTMRTGQLAFDLRAAAAFALERAGAVVESGWCVPCTACDPRFFSHRRDARRAGTTGRQGLIAWRPSR